jgi:hypothetical protein
MVVVSPVVVVRGGADVSQPPILDSRRCGVAPTETRVDLAVVALGHNCKIDAGE